MGSLSKLPNIGHVLETQLKEAGINTPEELREAGSQEAWLRIRSMDSSACYNRLCALEGAIQLMRWHDLTPEVKGNLKEFYSEHKR